VFDYLADGNTLEEFFEDFPSVGREAAVQVLEAGGTCLADLVHGA
jgi:hypothetical protein